MRQGYRMQRVKKSEYNWVVVVRLPSRVRLFAIPWTAAPQAALSLTISYSLPKFMSVALVMPSSHLILWYPLLLPSLFPSIRDFSNESGVCIRWPKYWSFSFNISPSNEYSGLISLKIVWFDFLLSKGLSEVFSSTIEWRHKFFSTLPFLTVRHSIVEYHHPIYYSLPSWPQILTFLPLLPKTAQNPHSVKLKSQGPHDLYQIQMWLFLLWRPMNWKTNYWYPITYTHTHTHSLTHTHTHSNTTNTPSWKGKKRNT